jgi:hypothetical protein
MKKWVGAALTVITLTLGYWRFSSAREFAADSVVISGQTQHWLDGDQYKSLPGVTVSVTRQGSIVDSTKSADNHGEAKFGMTIKSGEPIQVVFYFSKDFVPEMQSLSGKAGSHHHLSAALMTVAQFQEMRRKNGSLMSLKEKLSCIAAALGREHPLYSEIERTMREAE